MKYIDGDDEYIEDNDLGILYHKVQRLKQENFKYQQAVMKEKKKLKKDIEDICHQMKTPLATLLLYHEMLMKKYEDEIVCKGLIQIEKMNHFMKGLLKLSQVETISFQYDLLPIGYIVDLSLQSVYSFIQSHHVCLHHDVMDISFYCDESWLQEAFSNIFKNAIENDCQTLSISYEYHEQYFKMYIHNDGKEISDKDLPHIFERFYHTKNASGNGVGIGLSLTQEIIQKHHGHISVYNQDGVVFEITFPLYALSQKYDVTKM